MHPDSRRPDPTPASRAPLKPAYGSDRDLPAPQARPEPRKTSRSASDSLTAKLQDYRNWWNLPRARSRKTHT